MAVSGVVSGINGDFRGKLKKYSHPCILRHRMKGLPLELGTGARV